MNAKPQKLKIRTKNKCYSLTDSVLYKLSSKKRLADLLFRDIKTLKQLTNDENYHCFEEKKSGKSREIEHPLPLLDAVHTRIASLLCRIDQPSYIHSGIKGRSHISNAKSHIGEHPVLATDLQAFFQTTSRKHVFGFFYNTMKCSSDVSELLSKLCTYKDHIPTGSRISMPLAFWANYGMFSKLSSLSRANNICMTVFVDDLTFSGKKVSRQFRQKVEKIISSHGQIMHPKKTRLYKPAATKVITGVAVDSKGIKVANKQHKGIYEDMVQWMITKDIFQLPELNNRLLGKISSQSQIDPRFKDKARSLKSCF